MGPHQGPSRSHRSLRVPKPLAKGYKGDGVKGVNYDRTAPKCIRVTAEAGEGRWTPGAPPRLYNLEQLVKKKTEDGTTVQLDELPRKEAAEDFSPGVSRGEFNATIEESE